jgi:hypothetical protein
MTAMAILGQQAIASAIVVSAGPAVTVRGVNCTTACAWLL